LLITSRKGLSPLIVCGDCGHTVTCHNCSAPVVLYGKKDGSAKEIEKDNFFRCHHCGESRSAREKCVKCDSWKLNMIGVGIEKVREEIEKIVPKQNVFVLDKESASTHNKAKKITKEFLDNPSGVMISTEMSLLYLQEEVENVVIVSIDSMFSIPDFQIKERILNILLRAREKATEKFYIQTRNIKNSIFNEALKGNLADFYRSEFIDRKKYNYPPFSFLIKISGAANTKDKIQKDFGGLRQFLLPYELQTYSSFTEKVNGKYLMNGLVKLKAHEWISAELSDKLKNLPPQLRIEIDANSVI
jgi:primosomal protein N' (replication factor Y)